MNSKKKQKGNILKTAIEYIKNSRNKEGLQIIQKEKKKWCNVKKQTECGVVNGFISWFYFGKMIAISPLRMLENVKVYLNSCLVTAISASQ